MEETSIQYIIKADLSRMEKNQINIEVKDHTPIFSGEKDKKIEESKGHRFFRKERSFGYFSRSIPLPDNANESSINVEYKDGILVGKVAKILAETVLRMAKEEHQKVQGDEANLEALSDNSNQASPNSLTSKELRKVKTK